MTTEKLLNFTASPEDVALCRQVAERAASMAAEQGITCDAKVLMMDVLNLHCNGTPLALLQLLMSAPPDFMDDINGIVANIDRRNGGLLHGVAWLPRFARKSAH